MTKERYEELDNAGTGLTQAEYDAGWHFCHDWDGLLIGPDPLGEAECCTCHPMNHKETK